jgi:uncharacterized protein involved in response to NO
MLVSAMALLAWSLWQTAPITPVVLVAAGAANIFRLWRWVGIRTWREPLTIVLHIAYVFIPIGFVAMAAVLAFPEGQTSGPAVHLWTAGGIGMMTLAVMTRASLGHTGQKLQADWSISLIFVSMFASVLLRYLAGYVDAYTPLIHASAAAWLAAFSIFVLRFIRSFLLDR